MSSIIAFIWSALTPLKVIVLPVGSKRQAKTVQGL